MPAHDPQMLKGVLAVLLLSLLAEEDGYGYGIVTRLRQAGFSDVAEGHGLSGSDTSRTSRLVAVVPAALDSWPRPQVPQHH